MVSDHSATNGTVRGTDAHGPVTLPNAVPGTPLLALVDIYKRYGGVHALRGADFEISAPGVVHALIGENGSGKSTLLGILAGLTQPDSGVIRSDGEEVTIDSPAAAVKHRIATVSQETAVALDLSVAENVLMGRLPRRHGAIDWRAAHARTAQLLARLGMACDPRTLVREVRPDERQMVEIARALSMDPRILILDEPTSSLTEDEVEAVLDAIRLLKTQSVATILVSHRLQELFAVADEVTVLRDGSTVAAGPCTTFTSRSLIAAMVGEEAAELAHSANADEGGLVAQGNEVPVLALHGVSGTGFRNVSLQVQAGEIVGLAGLVGSGRGDVLRALFGVQPPSSGTIQVAGQEYRPLEPADAIAAGIGYVPPERKTDGLVLEMTVKDNLAMVATAGSHIGLRGTRATGLAFHDMLDQLSVRRSALDAAAGTLSGGNQQKIVIAKWLLTDRRLLMLGEPTRGVDVVSRSQIHALLRDLASTGVGLLVSSSENPELLELCDRIIVMFQGRVIQTFDTADVGEAQLAALCGGHEGEAP